MVVLRLAPAGKKGEEVYRLVVADKDYSLKGRYLEKVGLYTPNMKNKLELDQERLDYWLSKGAQPTTRVKHVLKTNKTAE